MQLFTKIKSNQSSMVNYKKHFILSHAIAEMTKTLLCISQLCLPWVYATHDSCAVAVFRERLIKYLRDKDIEVT